VFLCKKLTTAKFVVIYRQNKGLQMTFDEVIQTLSKETLTANFTPNFYTGKRYGIPYGYYEIQKSSLGPVMIEVDYFDDQEENPADMIQIKTQNLDEDSLYAFDNKTPFFKRLFKAQETTFGRGIRFVRSLKTIPSNLTEDEANLRLFHFKDSEEAKKRLNEHYLNARVMYDIMHEMMGAKCTFYPRNGGCVIKALFDGDYIETIGIKRTAGYYDISKVTYGVMNIIIPSVDLRDSFDDHTNSVEMMLFTKAEEFINMANTPQNNRTVAKTFTRWDKPYIDMMAKIKSHRVKAK
jgi:hypothetical protein